MQVLFYFSIIVVVNILNKFFYFLVSFHSVKSFNNRVVCFYVYIVFTKFTFLVLLYLVLVHFITKLLK